MYLQANNNGIEIPFYKWIVKLLDMDINHFGVVHLEIKYHVLEFVDCMMNLQTFCFCCRSKITYLY